MDTTGYNLSKLRYDLYDLEQLYIKYPQSLPLRNGIARIREILGMPQTVEAIDPVLFLDILEDQNQSRKQVKPD